MTSEPHRLARAPRAWLLWLALVLLAAHSLATWHPYSHTAAEVAGEELDGKHQIELTDCNLCLAGAANLGSAPPMVSALLPPRLAPQAPTPMRMASVQPAPSRQPYAIRAPPAFAG